MKKLLLFALVALGGVMNANATDYYVAGTSANVNGDYEWSNTADVNKMIAIDNNHYYLVVEGCALTTGETYKFKITPYDDWQTTYPASNYEFSVSKAGNYTLIYTFDYSNSAVNVVPVLNLTLSNNYNGANIWDSYNENGVFSHELGTYKWTLDLPASSITTDYWYFRIFKDGLLSWNNTDGKNKIVPNEENKELTIGGDADASAWIGTNTRSWKVPYLDCVYDHYTITLEYNVASQYANNWKVSVDAIISKTVSGANQYATFGTTVPVDLSNLGSVTAYTLTANATTGKITKTQKTGALAANEGVLLENLTGSNVTLSIPVAASASASSSNDLHAYTGGSAKLTQPGSGDTYYILSIKDEHVGFYSVGSNGNTMGVNTAYLSVPSSSRSAFYFDDDEATNINGIENAQSIMKSAYNLNGQRVAQPTKGLYIVNGKKVIMK